MDVFHWLAGVLGLTLGLLFRLGLTRRYRSRLKMVSRRYNKLAGTDFSRTTTGGKYWVGTRFRVFYRGDDGRVAMRAYEKYSETALRVDGVLRGKPRDAV